MLVISTGALPEIHKPSLSETDMCRLDRMADVLVSQGFLRQGERLAHIAAGMREGDQCAL